MHYFVLVGSHRPTSQSTKVGKRIEYALGELFPDDTTTLFDLRNNPLPLWNDWYWDDSSDEYKEFMQTRKPIRDELRRSDGLVVVSPEWSGMATPGLKNFFLYCGPEDIGNKPALLTTVSSGAGGRYPITELRISSYKNTQLCYIPQHILVDQVNEKLNDHTLSAEDKDDNYIRQRLQYSLKMLNVYSKGLRTVRESDVPDFDTYPFGM